MIGLLYTPVSIYQMTRGALVLWVGLFSVMFLRRKLYLYQWLSLVTVMAGVSVVGLSGSLAKDTGKGDSLLSIAGRMATREEPPTEVTVFIGILFILFAQLFTATQFVVEEKIMSIYSLAPLEAVGWEGFFGAGSIVLAIPVLTAYKSVSPFFDLARGWTQMTSSFAVLWSSVAIMCSIALFNACGLAVTRHVSATARSTADTCRTILIWTISLALGWEHLIWPWTLLQLVGFGLLVYGTFVFNDLYEPPSFLKPAPSSVPGIAITSSEDLESAADERRALLAQEHLDETATLPADLGTGGYDVVPPPGNATNARS
ncbi:hypothetical protein DL93DRAFT_2075093 [Clavulina sp. PMI_390]|nr:hypothetical protein DL93DRAFT_2075093 [Clavulina sp. PMI_390]